MRTRPIRRVPASVWKCIAAVNVLGALVQIANTHYDHALTTLIVSSLCYTLGLYTDDLNSA